LSTQANINPDGDSRTPQSETLGAENSPNNSPDNVHADEPHARRGHKPRERKDIASGELRDPADMLRLGFSPDGLVVADIYGKLPGRGAWIEATRASVDKAIKTGAFSRAAKRKVIVPNNFADTIEAGLSARVLGLLGMAKRAGQLESGFENVRSCARSGEIGVRIEASDGQPDGRSKIRVVVKAIAKELEVPMPTLIGCFDSTKLGQVIGRDNMVHACVHKGKMAKAITREIDRLAGFRELIPNEWPDREHENEKTPDLAPKTRPEIEPETSSDIGGGI